ncbi:mechanosensitive ion channel family protein [Corynebacterium aquatimens]|uniref:mechanosensitive ion channel family protein n=1 Tax=Corynebacterium TaxID=1716 RepID=UPI001F45E9F2|nr:MULTISPECIES: mechanosensitive ion channel family protein [Corynebacterium]QYH19331.1 mechanosensitive ion channel family protein [Corynebacterium aquatimens]UIZ91770.1 mechanosensitive ion channel family protein [Corynebacterium sp. CNCTC7651]
MRTETVTMLAASAAANDAVNDLEEWINDPQTRNLFVERPLWILLIIVIAIVLQMVLNRIINRAAQRSIANPGGTIALRRGEQDDDSPQARSQEQRRQARIKTLANVGRSAVAIIIWVWAAMAVLDQLGVNVAPLVASAGVVGVALGFGAQSLVKDFLSGMFMLIENQYGVGDSVQIGDISGTVEHMTMRITTVRDIDGTLWYIRNGDIDQVGNQSDVYSVARLEVPISLSSDPSDAAAVIERASIAAVQDDTIRDSVIGQPEVLGMSSFTPDHLTYRVSVKTMPGAQWAVSRHMYEEILEALQDAQIVMPGLEPRRIITVNDTPEASHD